MPKTQIRCPNCRQPVVADIEQLFDVNVDPSAKQKMLSGGFNLIQCRNCGYQGNASTPLVYHDPDKELLLTFVPPELGLPRNEQERLIGGLINQVVNKLPQEKRKGYLLRPQESLTLQGLVERILEGEGITREMIQGQQQRVNLIQRLASVSEEARPEIIQHEDALIDAEFFGLLRRVAEATMMSGDQASAQQLAGLQESLMKHSTFGRELQSQAQEMETAMADLRAFGRELNREKLLDLVIKAPSDLRVQALTSLARPLMDYSFFQLLSERIDRARGEGRSRLVALRQQLLSLTQEIDQQMEAHAQQARQLLEGLLQQDNIAEAVAQSLPAIDDFFLQELNTAMEEARQKSDLNRIGKLQQIVDVIQQASTPPEVALIEEFLEPDDEAGRQQWLDAHRNEITPEFLESLTNILAQVQSSEDKELAARVQAAHRSALRFSMQQNLR